MTIILYNINYKKNEEGWGPPNPLQNLVPGLNMAQGPQPLG